MNERTIQESKRALGKLLEFSHIVKKCWKKTISMFPSDLLLSVLYVLISCDVFSSFKSCILLIDSI